MATVYPSIRPFPSVGRYNLATYDSNFRYSRLPTYKPEWRWTRRVIITEQSGNDLTDYQVLVTLTWKNFEFHKAEADGRDIRFVDPSTWRFLPYWIEKWDSENYLAKVWVKVPSIPANSTKEIYLLYGNPEAVSMSDGKSTFVFFEDWENWTGTTTNPEYHGWEILDKDTNPTYQGDIQVNDTIVYTGNYSVKKNYGVARVDRSDLPGYLDVIVELWVNVEVYGSAGGEEAIILTAHDGVTGRVFGYYAASSTSNYSYAMAGTWYTTGKPVYPTGEWHLFQIAALSDGSKFFVDGEEVASTSDVIKVNIIRCGSSWNKDDECVAYFDTLKIRKYAEPEPKVEVR